MEERVRVGVHDPRAVEVQGLDGRVYKPIPKSGGMYELPASSAKALVDEGGFKPGIGGAAAGTPGGHVCPRGHRNFLPTCGRCDDIDTREEFRRLGINPLVDPRVDGGTLTVYSREGIDERGRAILYFDEFDDAGQEF